MRILGLLVVLCFAYVSDAFAACAPTRMLRIVTTVDAFGLPADHFVTQPKSVNAKTEPADGGMIRYSHEAEGIKASLVVNPKQRPERLEIEGPEARFVIKFLSYEDSEFQADLFSRPNGIRFSER